MTVLNIGKEKERERFEKSFFQCGKSRILNKSMSTFGKKNPHFILENYVILSSILDRQMSGISLYLRK